MEQEISNNYLEQVKIKAKSNKKKLIKPKIIFVIIIFLWTIQEQLFKIYKNTGIRTLDFWTTELLIISFFHSKVFNSQFYLHQIFSIAFSMSLCILKIVKIFITKNAIKLDLIKSYKWLIPVGIFVHLLFMIERSYILTKVKWYIDIKNISTNNLLIAFNLIGMISFLCFTIMSTFIKCFENEFSDKLCVVYEDEKIKYFENFIIYFSKYRNGIKELIIEIAAIFFGSLLFFVKTLLHILVIKYLSPIYIIFLQPIYFIFYKIILIIITLINEHTIFIINGKSKDDINDMTKSFILDILGDVLCCIAFLIYLEIIEFNFCRCNYNLKKNIIKRSESESSFDLYDSDFIFCINGDIEEVDIIKRVELNSNKVRL